MFMKVWKEFRKVPTTFNRVEISLRSNGAITMMGMKKIKDFVMLTTEDWFKGQREFAQYIDVTCKLDICAIVCHCSADHTWNRKD